MTLSIQASRSKTPPETAEENLRLRNPPGGAAAA